MSLTAANQLEYATQSDGIRPATLERLGAHLGEALQPGIQADALIAAEAGVVTSVEPTVASPIVQWGRRRWFVNTTYQHNRALERVFAWNGTAWHQRGQVLLSKLFRNPLDISSGTLSGLHALTFELGGGGMADTTYFTVISDVGGSWHAIPFVYGYGTTTVVNGLPATHGHLVSTEVDYTSSAGGPTTVLYERFHNNMFEPTTPPGIAPTCNANTLNTTVDPQLYSDGLGPLFTYVRCADGWALATGSGMGYAGPVVGLFEQGQGKWNTVTLDNGNALDLAPDIYDIPMTLLARLGAGVPSAVAPEVALGNLLARLQGKTNTYRYYGLPTDENMLSYDGTNWCVVTRSSTKASIYKWTKAKWSIQGNVTIPSSLDPYSNSIPYLVPLQVPGTSIPGFAIPPNPSKVIDDVGGIWHVAAFTHTLS